MTIYNSNLEKVLFQISEIVTWYHRNTSSLDLNELCIKRDKLVTLNAFLGDHVANAGLEKGLSYIHRKYMVSDKVVDYKEKQKIAIGLSEHKAIVDVKKELEDEKDKESKAERLYLAYRSNVNILTAMQQRISIISKELEANRDHIAFDSRIKAIEEKYEIELRKIQERVNNAATLFKEKIK